MARFERIARAAGAALLLLGLGSCSYVVRIRAAFINGQFGFVLAEGQRAQGSHCISLLTLSSETGEPVWELERPEIKLDGCAPWLPLIHGSEQPGVRTMVPAQRLRMETLYVLRGLALDSLEGAFVLHRAGGRLFVENLAPHSDRETNAVNAADNWLAAQPRPRTFENAHLPQNEIVEGPFEDRPLPAGQH